MSAGLHDLEVHLPDLPGALADLGQALGEAGVSLEGGGVFTHDGHAVAHYLVHDGARALAAVTAAGLGPAAVRDVVLARLDQEVPGQLGTLARRLGDAGVNVLVQYSDHVGNLVLLVADDDAEVCRAVVGHWGRHR
ncbi:ACT domain-containing protein [Promicromonospora sp. NPDC057138]|uniref:ACT domain-containing protein n=1 Tax=Promicromonospora sp. NPDC057138 TaxID=3346031 RepID=UPI0036287529